MAPRNRLEAALAKAADDPASRPEFYRLLLDSTIYVIGFTDAPEAASRVNLKAGENLSIVNWETPDGKPIIPFFASLEALQRGLQEESQYVGLPARTFFEITRGSSLVLNPGSPWGKEFFPQEVNTLLESGVNQVPTTRVVEKETSVLLGQPADYPAEMVAALSRLLTKHSSVNAAYLCLMHDPAGSEKPNLVVGFEGDGDLGQVLREAGTVAADT
ncbi:MAG: enhanced serine sensitivity protein SseB C-terminal domain-containing protein, partial [Thermoanaerobaculia bacterium]|nr:enhanced serine sensitivity protein SseB C-terminal domain-containing protein [Thermoanaerobaculia bacterium]